MGYQNKRFYLYEGKWDICIYEADCARNRRFCVMEMSQVTSRHEELDGPDGAKAAVLRRLIELAKQQEAA